MALDRGGRASHRNRFDYVRIKCSLHQEINIANALCFFFKDFDKDCAYCFSLLFGIDNLPEPFQKALACIDAVDVQFHRLLLKLLSSFEPTFLYDSVVNEYTS